MTSVPHSYIEDSVHSALTEDIGNGDITSRIIPEDDVSLARVISREKAIICGVDWFEEVFNQLDSSIFIDWEVDDGDLVAANQQLCTLSGSTRTLLTGERTALNFLQTLSGTATLTRRYVDAIKTTNTKLLDTRKTIPGLRMAQKYAVSCGGGVNHRIGLFDAILIKENHIMAAGSIAEAIASARFNNPDMPVEIEVENLDELQQAIAAKAERVLLDNFDLELLRQAVAITNKQLLLEASGGVNLDSILAIAQTGVDFISCGALTKDIISIDLSMRFI
jgi:nicotinate-nucleotide pyrophosphorylase (carboxylating)